VDEEIGRLSWAESGTKACKVNQLNAWHFLNDGKTSLITGMISKRGRPFSSFLVCTPGEKRLMSWEFPPREAKPKAEKKPKKIAGVNGR
jgi:DNA topoisomerase III